MPETLNKFRIDVAAAADNLLSRWDAADKRKQALPIAPAGIAKPPKGSAEPLCFAPARSGGRTEPKLIAIIGSIAWLSNQRPNQPVLK